MPHFSFRRPLGEFHLGHQLWLNPGGDSFILNLCGKGRFRSLQLDELAIQLLQRFIAEARANMADIAPAIVLSQREGKGTEKRASPPWSRKSRDDDFLAFGGLDLQPVVCACAGLI